MFGSGKHILGPLIALFILNGCGGGGGGGGLSIKPKSQTIDIQAKADTTSLGLIDVSIDNYEDKKIFINVESETYKLIKDVSAKFTSKTDGFIKLKYKAHSSMAPGVYNDNMKVRFCYDRECNNLVNGSPFIVKTTYSVPNKSISISKNNTSIDLLEVKFEPGRLSTEKKIPLNVNGIGINGVYIKQSYTGDATQYSYVSWTESNRLDLFVELKNPDIFDLEDDDSEIEINACYDYQCNYLVHGSPIKISVNVKATETISLTSQKLLDHNIVDAEFNPVLNSIVMVSSEPSNSAYIYDTDSELSYKIELNKEPTAVTVANDNGAIAIGHDDSISVIEPNTLQLDKSTVSEFEVSSAVYDLVMNNKKVHFIPKSGQWTDVVTVDTNTKKVSTSTGPNIYDSSKIKLSPSGNSLYIISTSLSPSDIAKFGISPDSVEYKYDSPYHGDYGMCDGMWLYQTDRIYTRCGNTFSTSDNKDDDIIYTGTLPLVESMPCSKIEHLVEANTSNEVMYIEDNGCYPYDPDAKQRLRLSESDTLENRGYYSLPKDNGSRLRGDYVFYNNNDKRFLISHTKEDSKHYLSEINIISK
ncbi:hypothetical protein A3712_13085 [Vibrio sp. HI00D65]|uniref:YncE family protein n=1 Tax=Vibrio sp. HI00D65 TaxID=1822216 RepID=UPI0007B9F6D8|nr:hypothetical protein [Vibrio sp. HI00D65]KZX68776.1 hypothetical protein A3712_13085 [Vibrio sp. HI00D65]